MPIMPMTFAAFESYCGRYHKVPIAKEILADGETPLSTYCKLAHNHYTFLFESVESNEQWGRYSFIGLSSSSYIQVHSDRLVHTNKTGVHWQGTHENPLNYIEHYMQQMKIPQLNELPVFYGGLVGYFGFDTIRYVEPKLTSQKSKDLLHIPDILLMETDEVVIFDNLSGTVTLVTHADATNPTMAKLHYQTALDRLKELEKIFLLPLQLPPLSLHAKQPFTEQDCHLHTPKRDFLAHVEYLVECIHQGDAMQIVPSHCLSAPYEESALNLYRALRYLNPSPYMYLLSLKEFSVVGSSPEILSRVRGQQVTVRPLAGTAKRTGDATEDQKQEKALLADEKEVAEHLMLIDLARNDISKICKPNSVRVYEQMKVSYYSHVMHIASTVIGDLLNHISPISVLMATHPAGTLSGAPKIKAIELIDRVENYKRGLYGGAVGYISWQGNMDLAIAIRTAVVKQRQLYVQVGCGVVADSIPHNEWQETLNKAGAIFQALSLLRQ